MLLLLDNYDSFSYNLVDYFAQLGIETVIFKNDSNLEDIIQESYSGIVLSPGPGAPKESGILMEVIGHYHNILPMLGICLGHQAIGEYFGCKLIKAKVPMHGKVSELLFMEDPLFDGFVKGSEYVRYNSLVLDSIPDCLSPIAWSNDGEIMAIKHSKYPITGIQFHPEAYLTDKGIEILKNWLYLNVDSKISVKEIDLHEHR